MISYADIESEVSERLGTTYSNDTHNPAKIRRYINDAIEKMSETIFRDNFIFEYTFTATGDRNSYDIPIQHSTKQIFADSTEIYQGSDWCLGKDRLNYPGQIAVYPDSIYLPTATNTGTYTILYRGVPWLLDSNDPSTTSIDLPRPYRRAIVPLAAYFGFLWVKQTDMATEQLVFYKEEIGSIAGAFMDPNENTPKRISSKHHF